jgi:hypothetical protein
MAYVYRLSNKQQKKNPYRKDWIMVSPMSMVAIMGEENAFGHRSLAIDLKNMITDKDFWEDLYPNVVLDVYLNKERSRKRLGINLYVHQVVSSANQRTNMVLTKSHSVLSRFCMDPKINDAYINSNEIQRAASGLQQWYSMAYLSAKDKVENIAAINSNLSLCGREFGLVNQGIRYGAMDKASSNEICYEGESSQYVLKLCFQNLDDLKIHCGLMKRLLYVDL